MGAVRSPKQSSTHISSRSDSLPERTGTRSETGTPHRARGCQILTALIQQTTSEVRWQFIFIKVINYVISPARPESYVYACETDFTAVHSRTQFIWKLLNSEFISRNSEFISRNSEFISHNSEFISRNSEFISRNSEFISRNSELYLAILSFISRNSEFISRNSEFIYLNSEFISQF